MKTSKTLLALLAAFAVNAHADVVAGGSSNTGLVTVPATGSNQSLPGVPDADAHGKAGIQMPTPNNPDQASSGVVSFQYGPIRQTNQALNNAANGNAFIELKKLDGSIVRMSETWKETLSNGNVIYAYRQINNALPGGFPQFGGQVIGRVSGITANADGSTFDVYFGEWAPKVNNPVYGHDTNLNMDSEQRTAWYVGESPTTSMPTLSNVTYDVTGVKQYVVPEDGPGGNVITGTLTANYGNGNNSIRGTLGGVNFAGTSIGSDGIFGNGSTIEGRFYGDQAQAIGGLYKNGTDSFGFGGKKAAN